MKNVLTTQIRRAKQSLPTLSGQTDRPLMGPWADTKPHVPKRVDVTFEDATGGVLVIGASGTGKTVGVVETALAAAAEKSETMEQRC